MSVEVADRGLLATVLERRLQRKRERGLVDRDREGCWYPTAAGIAATISPPSRPYALTRVNDRGG